MTNALPTEDRMFRALMEKDPSFDGVFFTAVRTTGVFCRPSCPARPPKRANVQFFAAARGALLGGFRPCLRCRPLEPPGETPAWLRPLLAEVERRGAERFRDADLRRLGCEPARTRRWFLRHHGTTFHAYVRARRVGAALCKLREGAAVLPAAADAGYESASGFYAAFAGLVGKPPARARGVAQLHLARIATPLGPMVAGATDDGLCLLEFADRRMLETQLKRLVRRLRCVATPAPHRHLARVEAELARYFAGEPVLFRTPLVLAGTPFQELVWRELLRIPRGATRSYGQQAASLGRPSAVRAVARANGDNRIAILIPCHRVVGTDGRLTGYGGGLWRKQRLLEFERSRLAADGAAPTE